MAELKDVLTPKQVAEYLQMHPITIYRYINEGRLAAAKIGGRYRIRREAVAKFLADREQETAQETAAPSTATIPSAAPGAAAPVTEGSA